MIRARGFIARKVGSGATGSDELADGSAQTSAARSGVKQSAHDAVPYARNAPIVVAKEILDTEFAGHGKDAGPIGVDRNASGFGRACPGAAGRLGAGGPADQEFVEIRNQVVRGAVADPAATKPNVRPPDVLAQEWSNQAARLLSTCVSVLKNSVV